MGLLDKLFGKFNKIDVSFVNAATGEEFARAEVTPLELEGKFELNASYQIKDGEWVLKEAIPSLAEAVRSKTLTLKMNKIERMNPADILFTIPTISNELAGETPAPLFHDFELSMHEDDWRQCEFLNISSLNAIDKDIAGIKNIWNEYSQANSEGYHTFTQCYVRTYVGNPNLTIDFEQLKALLKVDKIGCLKFFSASAGLIDGYVQNVFVFKTNLTTYYGVLEGATVTALCVENFSDDTIHEIENICNEFNLVFLNWRSAGIIQP